MCAAWDWTWICFHSFKVQFIPITIRDKFFVFHLMSCMSERCDEVQPRMTCRPLDESKINKNVCSIFGGQVIGGYISTSFPSHARLTMTKKNRCAITNQVTIITIIIITIITHTLVCSIYNTIFAIVLTLTHINCFLSKVVIFGGNGRVCWLRCERHNKK